MTILVVEDEVLIRMAVSDDLREAGFKVVEAYTADQALAYLGVNPSIAVVFSDVRLPGSMDGVQFMRVVRDRFPAVKVVLTSGHWSSVAPDGETPLIRKPYLSQEVIARVRAVLA